MAGIRESTDGIPARRPKPVKLLRIWLLVLLAVLLPVRGAMAAAMACPPPASAAAQQLMDIGAHAFPRLQLKYSRDDEGEGDRLGVH